MTPASSTNPWTIAGQFNNVNALPPPPFLSASHLQSAHLGQSFVAENRIKDLIVLTDNLKEELRAKEEERGILEWKNRSLKAECDTLEAKNRSLKAECDTLNARCQFLITESQSLKKKLEEEIAKNNP